MKTLVLLISVVLVLLASLIGTLYQIKRALRALYTLNSYNVEQAVVALVAVGLLTMALIQAARGLFPLRALYHRRRIKEWLGHTTETDKLIELLHQRLGIVKSDTDFYDLPIQNICGQIAAVAESILVEHTNLDHPSSNANRRLLKAFAGPNSEDELAEVRPEKTTNSSSNDLTDGPPVDPPPAVEDRFSMARARIGSRIQRNIDQLQISAGTRWRRLLRTTASGLSFLFAVSLLRGLHLNWEFLGLLGAALIAGLIGGYLASVFRDLVAVIEGLRRQ